MPAETNILITYNATMTYQSYVTHELDPHAPVLNMIFWVNNDIVPHTIVAEDQSWTTGIIVSGKLGVMSLNHTGTYKYFIKEKPDTTGVVEFSGLVNPEGN